LMSCFSAPGAPRLTTPSGLAPAKDASDIEPIVALDTGTAALVTDPAPSATELSVLATADGPIATLSVPLAVLSGPVELV
jgi:hypothetical protein